MMKTSSSETKRLREAERKKKEKQNANRLEYYYAKRESINRKRREKRAQARELKAAQWVTDTVRDGVDNTSKPKKYDWALYKRRQRARAKEEMEKQEGKAKCKCRRKEGQMSTTTFPSRMSKKRSSSNNWKPCDEDNIQV